MPYGVLQAYSVVILVALAALQPSRYTHGNVIYGVFAAYVLAKVLEHFDRQFLALGGIISGHTLKHVVAAIAALLVCHMLWYRSPVSGIPKGRSRSENGDHLST